MISDRPSPSRSRALMPPEVAALVGPVGPQDLEGPGHVIPRRAVGVRGVDHDREGRPRGAGLVATEVLVMPLGLLDAKARLADAGDERLPPDAVEGPRRGRQVRGQDPGRSRPGPVGLSQHDETDVALRLDLVGPDRGIGLPAGVEQPLVALALCLTVLGFGLGECNVRGAQRSHESPQHERGPARISGSHAVDHGGILRSDDWPVGGAGPASARNRRASSAWEALLNMQ
jgi:hypothetical protein